MHTHQRGKSHSNRPVAKRAPSWSKYTPEEIEALIIKLAKEGNSPTKIGIILRDQYAIPLARTATGKTISEILKAEELQAKIPEPLSELLKKTMRLRRHLEKNKADYVNKRSLIIAEAKMHRLVKYYKAKKQLPPDWSYRPQIVTGI
jgi:small subunit ribosomal protein S15